MCRVRGEQRYVQKDKVNGGSVTEGSTTHYTVKTLYLYRSPHRALDVNGLVAQHGGQVPHAAGVADVHRQVAHVRHAHLP